MLVRSLLLLVLAGCTAGGTSDIKTEKPGPGDEEEAAGPIDVTGFGTDVLIDPSAGDSEAEPSTVALPDGTVLASWMNLEGYSLYIKYSRSTDGGKTWSEADYIDQDRWGYQNDPVLVQGGGYIYFTWLAVEGNSYDKSSIYCKDSTDGGLTWSDAVKLTPSNTFNDRQWMAVDADGSAVVTWDLFENDYLTEQAYSRTEGGCAGFADYDVIAEGSFLNGVPAIDTDGTIWTSRTEYDYRGGDINVIVQSLGDDGDWHEDTVYSTPYSYLAPSSGEDPAQERLERIESTLAGDEEREELREQRFGLPDPATTRLSGGMEQALILAGKLRPTRLASANFDGFYSPVLQPLPDGRLAIVSTVFEEGSSDTPDVLFATYDHGDTVASILNQDGPGTEQMEPWMVVDAWGGIHVSWFDAREGQWRLYGATSLDAGDSFTEYTISDSTFKRGFADEDGYAWVGHFQGLTASDDHVIAVWGDSSDDNVSILRSDASVGE